ncbi:MAG: restriction endonuclease subunit S [Acidimicrobiaceae bacterium]|nr:restriction endonuclease subunit S [Acidimicrobiaceae bacterium]
MSTPTVPLKYLAGINERSLPETTCPDFEFGYIDISSVGRGELTSEPAQMRFGDAPSRARRLLRNGDTIVSTVRTYLRAVWPIEGAADGLVASTGFAVLTPRAIEPRYFAWWVQSDVFIEDVVARSVGVSYPAINALELGELPVRVPPVAEQRAIADYLDAETVRIDALIAKKQQLIQLLEERLRAEMTELACGRLRGAPLAGSGIDWIGKIPASWQVVRLNKVARLESGHTPSRTREELWVDADKAWITLNDVGTLAESEFIGETKNLISDAGLAASSARMLPAHTVVLSRDATIGRVGIMATNMATSQHFAAWVCSSVIRPRFLWLLLRFAMQPFLTSFDDGATLRTIGMPHVRRFVVPLPPVKEQDEIVAHAETRRAAITAGGQSLGRQLELLAEHRQALITAAVTGEFAVPGAA